LHARIESAVLPLAEQPYLYRAGRGAGTRELVAHPNYTVIYRVAGNHVAISACCTRTGNIRRFRLRRVRMRPTSAG